MKKNINILFASLVAAFGLAVGSAVIADQTTLSDMAADVRDASISNDQSQVPDQDDRVGYAIVKYDFAKHGGTGDIELGDYLPEDTAIMGGYVQVVTPILPATVTNALSIQSAADLLAVGTSLNTAGFYALKPTTAGTGSYVSGVTLQSAAVGTNGVSVVTNAVVTTVSSGRFLGSPIVVTGATSRTILNLTGTTATQGVFYVFLDLLKVQ